MSKFPNTRQSKTLPRVFFTFGQLDREFRKIKLEFPELLCYTISICLEFIIIEERERI